MGFIQQGEGKDHQIVVIRFPDELPTVPPIYRELAFAELHRTAGVAFMQLAAKFSEHYTDPEPTRCRIVQKLKKHKGELEIIVLSDRFVEEDIVADWIRTLLAKPLMKWLQPGHDELFHLEALRAQEIAEALELEPDCLDEDPLEALQLEAHHEALWRGADEIDFVFSCPPNPSYDEPDETTFENVLSGIG